MVTSEQETLYAISCKKAAAALKKNNFEIVEVNDEKEALDALLKRLPRDSSIGYGGSKTLEEIGFFEHVTEETHPHLFNRRNPNLSPEEKQTLQKRALVADVFVCSANAVSLQGDLVFIDKWGNRNAAMTYGPGNRIVVVGANKISEDLGTAIDRARNSAAVLNNIRFDTKNPCTKQGTCVDCDSSDRLCSIVTIIQRCQLPGSITVILCREPLGF
jgi:hypothetical protein